MDVRNSSTSAPPLARPLARACLAGTAAASTLLCDSRADTLALAVRSLGLLGLVAALAATGPLRRFTASLPPPHKWAAGLLLGLFLAGHLVGDSRATFPFATWGMYSYPFRLDQIIFYQYRGIRADGSTIDLMPGEALPQLENCLYWELEEAGEEGRTEPKRMPRFESMVRAAGEAHNRSDPDRPLTAVAVLRGTFASPHGRAVPRWEPLVTVPLSEGG